MLKSMTGFARCEGALGDTRWHWELRSVNGRGLDVRIRLPVGCEGLETRVREACKGRFARGNCTVNLSLRREGGDLRLKLNEDALGQVVAAMARARELVEAGEPRLDGLLSIRGVLETAESEDDEAFVASRDAAVLRDLDRALEQIGESRAAEGAHLAEALKQQIDEIETLTLRAEAAPCQSAEAIRERLRDAVARLLDQASQLDEQRLHQEAVLIAARVDIAEEIDRLKAHVASARALLSAPEPVGRRLDFLTQEFNREANTICSKSNGIELTQTGLALKAVIERLREQVQNVE